MAAPAQVMLRSEAAQELSRELNPKRIRTVVVDDSVTFLRVACELLDLDPLIDLIARAGKGGEAIETVLKLQPDLILMDVHMPYLDGLTLSWFFAHRFPSARVVLMSTDESPELRKNAKTPAPSILCTKKISGKSLARWCGASAPIHKHEEFISINYLHKDRALFIVLPTNVTRRMTHMRTTLLKVTAFLALTSAFVMAQHGNPPDQATMVQHHINFLTKQLSLTPQQQQQATTLLTEVSNNAKTIHEQMKAAHDTLNAAIQKNDSAGIEAAASNIGNLTAQMTAAHAKAMATFRQTLTQNNKLR